MFHKLAFLIILLGLVVEPGNGKVTLFENNIDRYINNDLLK